jgi:hypothetical protein
VAALLRAKEDGQVRCRGERRAHVALIHEDGVHRPGAPGQHHLLEVGVVLPRQPGAGAPYQVEALLSVNFTFGEFYLPST